VLARGNNDRVSRRIVCKCGKLRIKTRLFAAIVDTARTETKYDIFIVVYAQCCQNVCQFAHSEARGPHQRFLICS
jgi:hypothetical protein